MVNSYCGKITSVLVLWINSVKSQALSLQSIAGAGIIADCTLHVINWKMCFTTPDIVTTSLCTNRLRCIRIFANSLRVFYALWVFRS